MTDAPWELWIDVGGTFTDCVGRRPDGELVRGKVLSSGVVQGTVGAGSGRSRVLDPGRRGEAEGQWTGYELRLLGEDGAAARVTGFDPETGALELEDGLAAPPRPGQPYELAAGEPAPILAIRRLLGLGLGVPLPQARVRLGTTRGTNALLTRSGAPTAFVTTRGFADVLEIGDQSRPRLFELAIVKRRPLYRAVAEIDERIGAGGEVLRAPERAAVRETLAELRAYGVEALAVCLMNAYADPRHELLVAEVARELGFEEVSVSSAVAPVVKIVARGDTTVLDAYLNPVLRSYVAALERALGEGSELRVLTSAGGLVGARAFTGKDSILSGPAGGVVGFSHVARAAGYPRSIGFDMGGTSTDVSRFDGRYELEYESEKAGVRVMAPTMAIETVAAGGGSICGFDGVKLTVGPESAGADPGPACYGRGGPLTVTDVNLLLGRLLPERFPFRLDVAAAERRLDALRLAIEKASGRRYGRVELADGYRRVADAGMVEAVRAVSVQKGCDPRDYALVAFGGAAPQHACSLARALCIATVLDPPDAGVLSARGLGLAEVTRHRARGVYRPYGEAALADLEPLFAELEREACEELEAEGISRERIETRRSLDLRYRGLDAFLTVAEPTDGETYAGRFEAEHRALYGYLHEGRELEIVAARVEAVGRAAERPPEARREPVRTPAPAGETTVYFDAEPATAQVYDRGGLVPGEAFAGPAIVAARHATTVVDPGWTAEILSDGQLLLRDRGAPAPASAGTERDPIRLEIFNRRFAGIAEQMGITLRNTSTSVNVKERLDFSCAVFTPAGDLVVNAPHMPVHLGAMAETVKTVLRDNPDLGPGDVVLTNDPYRGGSHLPDLTVVTPVHDEVGRLLFLTTSRAHHAEIGGVAPGSMPPHSTCLAEEGVLIRNFRLVAGGRSRFHELGELLRRPPYPSRAPEDNLADLGAQVAANRQGARDLLALVESEGLEVVSAYMGHIQAAAAEKMRAALGRLEEGRYEFVDHLDDGSPIAVAIDVRGGRARIDFSGSGAVVAGNLNANRAIVTAAVMYVLRCLIDEDIPLNQGVLEPIEIVVPAGLLDPPEGPDSASSPAVAGGNVETSQRVTDVLLGALGLAAASQGTMNNLLFGDGRFGYYETICGGAGGTPGRDGADAVHTHMTNTRLTDPEVLEQRFPVRLVEFAVRRGSGGRGRRRGGDGVRRRLELLRRLEVSILSQRRGPYPPYGLAGGRPGALGRNLLDRRGGGEERLGALARFTAEPGDVLTVETPGGGGYGEPLDEDLAGTSGKDV